MGEKEIVQDDAGSSGLGQPPVGPGGPGGGGMVGNPDNPRTDGPGSGAGGGGGKPTRDGPGGGGGSPGDQANDCADIQAKFKELSDAMSDLASQNRQLADKALNSFYGNEGYRDTLQKSKVTGAVVDSNNKVGKALIDVALFAAGGYAGVGSAAGAPSATMEAWFGKGIYGSKDSVAAIQGVASFLGQQTGAQLGGKEVEGGPLSGMADKAKDAVLDALGDWMKEGATESGTEAATKAYADFVGKATAANAAAAGILDIKKQLEDLIAKARARHCPEGTVGPVPAPIIRTFDLAPFGEGAATGQKGPAIRTGALDAGVPGAADLFRAGSKSMLPGY